MKLSLWTYEGPTHIGAMRVANSMKNAHLVLHAPQGDTYADLLFTMIERQDHRPPVTYTTFQARDLGGDTADLFVKSVAEAAERFTPEVMFVGESCTAELIQDQPGALAQGMSLDVPLVALELPAYARKENYGASETLYALVRSVLLPQAKARREQTTTAATPHNPRPLVNLIGPSSLGFRSRDDVTEITRLLNTMGIEVNAVAPLGATLQDIAKLPEASVNLCLYPEVGRAACDWLKREFGQPCINTVPIGVTATRQFIQEVADAVGVDAGPVLHADASRLPWYSRSIDSNYLTGKRVFIFGDATHALAAAKVASDELGFEVVGLGTYSREFARVVREGAKRYGVDALITDDYLEVEQAVIHSEPELVLGTQMERHIAKRLGIGCCVISAPFHVEDVPARYAPQMGYEGANVIFDNWVHPLMMGLEEHLLGMFTEDFEFSGTATPSHLGSHGQPLNQSPAAVTASVPESVESANTAVEPPVGGIEGFSALSWATEAEKELKKIPFFVRGKARKNTERYAADNGLATITIETLYDAKAHYSR